MVFLYKNWRPRRSVLFMPASNSRAIEKAPQLNCDGLIFDLEDSVSSQERPNAYRHLKEMVSTFDFAGKERVIRLNPVGSDPFQADLSIANRCGVDALLLPKVESDTELLNFSQLIDQRMQIWAMIETPKGLMNLTAICEASQSTNLTCLVVGPNDLAKSTGAKMESGRAVMLPWLMQVLAAARAFDLCVLDGVYNKFGDLKGLEDECIQGAAMGYDGKTLIHPNQIEAANRYFGVTRDQYERAITITEAFERPENANKAAIQIEQEMVERLHLASAIQQIEAYRRQSE